MKKRGQLYLVAAIIIIMAVFSLVTIKNYSESEKTETVVYDLEKELNIETGKVVDSAIVQQTDVPTKVEEWTDLYVTGAKPKEVEDWVFIYGNKEKANVLTYKQVATGQISITSGEVDSAVTISNYNKVTYLPKQTDKIEVYIGELGYSFNLKEKENFMLLIKKGEYVTKTI